MPVPRVINLNDLTPPAPAGGVNVKWQGDNLDPRNVSAYVSEIGGAVLKTASYTAVATDDKVLLSFNSATAVTLTLPATPPSPSWAIFTENIGAGALTVARNGLLIDTAGADLKLAQNQGLYLTTDGTNYFTERGNPDEPALVVCWFPGKPLASDLLGMLVIPDATSLPNGIRFPVNLTGSRGRCRVAPTATVVIAITNSGVSAGTVTISTGGIFTFATTGGVAFTCIAGDYLEFTAPGVADATLADISFTLAGVR